WIVIQHRYAPFHLSFNRAYQDYKDGFGDLNGEFWLGLQKIHEITSDPHVDYQLQFELYKTAGERLHWVADNFKVASEGTGYRETIDGSY
ncbi:hypothetical protein CAPTEDRAFT_27725, partial [Capitella teleta]